MKIKNHKILTIRPTSNGVIISEHGESLAERGYIANELAVFNDPNEMANFIKDFYLLDPDEALAPT